MTTIHVFGNPDLEFDSLPTRLMPRLAEALPHIRFRLTDPNELDLPQEGEDFVAIDAVNGLKDIREVSIDEIAEQAARSTAHDYDLASYLLLIRKIRKDIHIRIIGIPMMYDEEKALEKVVNLLKTTLTPREA